MLKVHYLWKNNVIDQMVGKVRKVDIPIYTFKMHVKNEFYRYYEIR